VAIARRAVIDKARAWLREALAAGPHLAKELRDEASERGIGRSALYAAHGRSHRHRQGAHGPGELGLDAQQHR